MQALNLIRGASGLPICVDLTTHSEALLPRLEQLGWITRTRATEPPRVRPRTERVFRIREGLDLDEALATLDRAPRQRAILETLAQPDALVGRGLERAREFSWDRCASEMAEALDAARAGT